MSMAGRCMAASTASGTLVGPGMFRNSRPLATLMDAWSPYDNVWNTCATSTILPAGRGKVKSAILRAREGQIRDPSTGIEASRVDAPYREPHSAPYVPGLVGRRLRVPRRGVRLGLRILRDRRVPRRAGRAPRLEHG